MVKKAMKKGMKAMMRMKKMKMTMATMEVSQPNFFSQLLTLDCITITSPLEM